MMPQDCIDAALAAVAAAEAEFLSYLDNSPPGD